MCLDSSVAPSLGVELGDTDMATVQDITVPQRVTTPVAKLNLSFVLETTHRDTGKTERRVFATVEERIAAFSKLDIHTHSYRFDDIDGGVFGGDA